MKERIRPRDARPSWAALVLTTSIALGGVGCAFNGTLVTIDMDKRYFEEQLCLGLFEITAPLVNGSGAVESRYYFNESEPTRRFSSYNEASEAQDEKFQRDLRSGKISAIDIVTGKADTPVKVFERRETYPSPKLSKSLTGIEKKYVFQKDPNMCWAASLETAFGFLGMDYPQEKFLAALRNNCSAKMSKSASLNQIFFAASEVRINNFGLGNGGRWIGQFPQHGKLSIQLGSVISRLFPGVHLEFGETMIGDAPTNVFGPPQDMAPDIPGMPYMQAIQQAERMRRQAQHQHQRIQQLEYSQATQPSKFFAQTNDLTYIAVDAYSGLADSIEWNNFGEDNTKIVSRGKLQIIRGVDELIRSFYRQNPVVVGMMEERGGHTVTLTDVEFLPGGKWNPLTEKYELDERARLVRVWYLDPTLGPAKQEMNGDEFLSKLIFSFYIQP